MHDSARQRIIQVMGSLILLLAVAILTFSYVRFTRRNRARWLKRINLVGVWHLEGMLAETPTFEFHGNISSGRYLFTDGDKTQQGSWRIGPTSLIFSPDNEESFECDLRLFDTGKIGIDGPGHQRKIYMKRADNVVVLRQSPSSD